MNEKMDRPQSTEAITGRAEALRSVFDTPGDLKKGLKSEEARTKFQAESAQGLIDTVVQNGAVEKKGKKIEDAEFEAGETILNELKQTDGYYNLLLTAKDGADFHAKSKAVGAELYSNIIQPMMDRGFGKYAPSAEDFANKLKELPGGDELNANSLYESLKRIRMAQGIYKIAANE